MANLNKAISVAVEMIANKIDEIYDAAEGFDGEPVDPAWLANRAIQELARDLGSRPAPKPVTSATAKPRANGKSCKFCGADGFKWKSFEGKWALVDSSGAKHTCRRPTSPAKEEEKETTFTDLLKGLKERE